MGRTAPAPSAQCPPKAQCCEIRRPGRRLRAFRWTGRRCGCRTCCRRVRVAPPVMRGGGVGLCGAPLLARRCSCADNRVGDKGCQAFCAALKMNTTLTSIGLASMTVPPPPPPSLLSRVALEGKGPQRRPQWRLDRRLEEVATAVGGGYCRLQMPLKPALAVRGTVAGHRLGAPEGGGGSPPPPSFPMHPCPSTLSSSSSDTSAAPDDTHTHTHTHTHRPMSPLTAVRSAADPENHWRHAPQVQPADATSPPPPFSV